MSRKRTKAQKQREARAMRELHQLMGNYRHMKALEHWLSRRGYRALAQMVWAVAPATTLPPQRG